jgi:hypothetical protein
MFGHFRESLPLAFKNCHLVTCGSSLSGDVPYHTGDGPSTAVYLLMAVVEVDYAHYGAIPP